MLPWLEPSRNPRHRPGGRVEVSGFEEVELRDGERQLGRVVGEWRALAASIEGSSYFQTPDWVRAGGRIAAGLRRAAARGAMPRGGSRRSRCSARFPSRSVEDTP